MELNKSGENGKKAKSLIFTILIILLLIPGLQSRFNFIKEPALSGAFLKDGKPSLDSLSIDSWFEGSFQEDYDKRLEENVGFRNYLVKINNQIDYSLFNNANVEGVIVGKQNMLIQEDYIHEYTGKFYVGDSVWIKKAIRLKAIQDTLKKLNKTLVIIIEPDKASTYPENLPDKYFLNPGRKTNYQQMLTELLKNEVNVLDLNNYFQSIKGKTDYPIFPQCGIHWSYYGATLAADTTVHYLEKLTKADLPEMKVSELKIPDVPRHPDYDIGLAMNLFFPIPHQIPPDPVIQFNTENKVRPNALVVGDSFYFNWLNAGIPKHIFSSCDFWYYNNSITYSDGNKGGKASDLNLKGELMKKDIILLMVTGCFMHSFAWGFDQQVYNLFYPGRIDPVEQFADQVRAYNDHFKRMEKDAVKKNMPLEVRIEEEAKYLFYEEMKKHPEKFSTKSAEILAIEMAIRSTPEWMKEIERKAKQNNKTVDEQLRGDAEYMYNEKMKKKNQ